MSYPRGAADRLHGKSTQPVEELPAVDVTGLSDDELSTLNSLLSRVFGPGETGDPASSQNRRRAIGAQKGLGPIGPAPASSSVAQQK